jgi:hypothetical protein
MHYNLAQPFCENPEGHPGNTAVSVTDSAVTHSEVRKLVQPIASWLREKSGGSVHALRISIGTP